MKVLPQPLRDSFDAIATLFFSSRSVRTWKQLTKLAGLRDQGILTEDEFAAKKAELLARF
ncbi:SHOCT domain-containing protein [Subtercola lobariae]|uniref:SHOCT domain-containing protein n=1 Tax=Subtercola lobariae TaxID=1588641 RepID=UPI00166B8FCD|nr:SHOCT domain-containing protein [Subtercola lobariae]